MSSTAITVQDLCKSYVVDHELKGGGYSNFRDLMALRVKKLLRSSAPAIAKEEIKVLNNISFTVQQGERLGIIGSNGAGKSTLLKILSRITEPTSGHINVKGRVVSLLEVGTGFHSELSGRENIFLNGVILGMSRSAIKKKFDSIVAFSEIEQFLDTPVKRYSSGMYMRLAFAVAAHMEPEILIVDEVLAVGDAQFQKKCITRMDEISRDFGITVLFVSHNMEAIRSFCTTGLFIDKGKLLSQGHIDDVTDDYINRYTPDGGFRPNNHKPVFFNSVALAHNNYYFADTMQLHCCIVSDKAHPRYIIGLSIADKLDHKVGTALISSTAPLGTGSNNVTLNIPLGNIVPGTYRITMSLALDETLDNLDVVFNYPEFNIISTDEHQQLFARWNQAWGSHHLTGTTITNT